MDTQTNWRTEVARQLERLQEIRIALSEGAPQNELSDAGYELAQQGVNVHRLVQRAYRRRLIDHRLGYSD